MDKKAELKQKILEAMKEADIASLYMMEQDAHENLDEETLHGFYANILDIALENLTNTLENHKTLDMQNVQDFATLRALYEYAIEHYSAGAIADASALFEVLSGINNDESFSTSLKIHTAASAQELDLDNFLENIADIDATQKSGTFYVSCFSKEAQKLLDNTQQKVGE